MPYIEIIIVYLICNKRKKTNNITFHIKQRNRKVFKEKVLDLKSIF